MVQVRLLPRAPNFMTWLRREKRIERGTLDPNESYEVEVVVDIYWNPETQQEEEAFDGEAMRKIEEAVEAAHPGWYHTCYKNPKQHCQACNRKQHASVTNRTISKV